MPATDYRQYDNLVTVSEVISNAFTHASHGGEILDNNIILIAEITHLKQHLGDYFWGELRRKNDSNTAEGEGLSNYETILLENYIKPCLVYFVKYEVLNDLQYNTTGSGVVTNDDEWSDPVDSSEMSILKNDTYRKAEILRKDMMEWLDDTENNGVFPDYESGLNDKHLNGDNVVKLGGILAYGNKFNRYRSINKKDERYYS